MEMTGCLQNCRYCRTIISNYKCDAKQKFNKNLLKSEDFSTHDCL